MPLPFYRKYKKVVFWAWIPLVYHHAHYKNRSGRDLLLSPSRSSQYESPHDPRGRRGSHAFPYRVSDAGNQYLCLGPPRARKVQGIQPSNDRGLCRFYRRLCEKARTTKGDCMRSLDGRGHCDDLGLEKTPMDRQTDPCGNGGKTQGQPPYFPT